MPAVQTAILPSSHADLVTDVAYDFYGLQLATCSLDQRIKLWRLDEHTGSWSIEHEWKAHDAPITNLSWAHPEFGTILASAGYDRNVKIWEETRFDPRNPTSTRWVERATLPEARGSVRAVEFSPKHFGLKLATIASDSHLRIYECQEPHNLISWTLVEVVDLTNVPSSTPTASTSTPTQTHVTLEGVSSTLSTGAVVPPTPSPQVRPGYGRREADGGWSLSWCKDKQWGELLAVTAGVSGTVHIVDIKSGQQPSYLLSLKSSKLLNQSQSHSKHGGSHSSQALTAGSSAGSSSNLAGGMGLPSALAESASPQFACSTVAWAPSCGRSYQLIAAGGRDGIVRVWKVKPPPVDGVPLGGKMEVDTAPGKWSATLAGEFEEHHAPVTRVEWNITGTVLSSAGHDGNIRLWKATYANVWRPMGHIHTEQGDEGLPEEEGGHEGDAMVE